MPEWVVERIVHFGPDDFVVSGIGHFGFHARDGRYYAIDHGRHRVALLGGDGRVEWTLAAQPFLDGVPNIAADLSFPMYVDVLPDATLVVSNFGNARLYRIDPPAGRVELLVDGRAHGLVDMGNCVVDGSGDVWVNEVRGCRIRRFEPSGRLVETLGDGTAGFRADETGFDDARFSWIYDLRRGPGETLYVLDSRNYALREIDLAARAVRLLAGTGRPGYSGDGDEARSATFGGDPAATFDGPISLSVDESGNAYVGDRFNRVVRMVKRESGAVSTIAGRPDATGDAANAPGERDPLRLRLPMISSMDYADGRLYVPTDLAGGAGDLAVLRKG